MQFKLENLVKPYCVFKMVSLQSRLRRAAVPGSLISSLTSYRRSPDRVTLKYCTILGVERGRKK